jgi:hypothetical protein
MTFPKSPLVLTSLVSLTFAFASTEVLAQEVGASGTVTAQTAAVAPAPPPPPAAAPAPSPAPAVAAGIVDDGSADHDKVVGHFGITYFGVSQIPVASGTGARDNIPAPAIGVRYWLNRSIGIDAGLGFGFTTGSSEAVNAATTTTVDQPSRFGLLLHGGVPFALAAGKHYTFEFIPELNVGFGTGTIKQVGNPAPPDVNLSGLKLDLGARVGAEVHFGFIGIPELALQASVGLFLRRESWKSSTTVNCEPWAIFANNISAIYYF